MPHWEYRLLLELAAIYVAARALGLAFERLALPGVLGEILAGIVLGPHGLAYVTLGETSVCLAQLGAIFLLFSVGLATRPRDLLRVGGRAVFVATAGVMAPFVLGFACALAMHRSPQEATFLAAAMVATSAGITARVLGDLGVLDTRAARIILGAAVFDDILGMLVLAVAVGSASASGVPWVRLGVIFVEAIGFALFMIFAAPRLIARLRPFFAQLALPGAPLVLALALCLGLAVLAEKIGLAAIIGAFFAGLALADCAGEWSLEAPVRGIAQFVTPFFFFATGARLDLAAITGSVLAGAALVCLLAIVSKLIGCGLPVLREGFPTALRVGVGMVPRGEVGLIIALVGLHRNALSPSGYAMVVFMTAVTTLLGPPALKAVFRPEPEAEGGGVGVARDVA